IRGGRQSLYVLDRSVHRVARLCLWYCFRRDRRRLNKFVMKNANCYELSTRFQLVENLRVLKLIMNASIAFSVWLPWPCSMIILSFLYFLPTTRAGQIVYASFELTLSLSIAGLFVFSVVALGATPKAFNALSCIKMVLRT
ncbi:hypothetical protein OSTOST_09941, partial [Ostertagia ostertagi]